MNIKIIMYEQWNETIGSLIVSGSVDKIELKMYGIAPIGRLSY